MGCFSMPKGVPNKRYTPEFKKLVIETMYQEHLSCSEVGRQFNVAQQRVCDWERIYLTEGPEVFYRVQQPWQQGPSSAISQRN